MSIDNFMLLDLAESLLGILLFPIILVFPGFLVGWVLNLLSFRESHWITRFFISVGLSVSIVPICAYLLIRSGLANLDWLPLLASVVGSALIILKQSRGHQRIAGHPVSKKDPTRRIWIVGISLIAFAILFSLVDLQVKSGLFVSTISYDYAKNISVTDAITRTGLPPINPSFYPGYPLEIYYYYFWFILTSLIDQLGEHLISARSAVIAGTVWSGIGLIAAVYCYFRMKYVGTPHFQKRLIIGLGLLLVSGLDALVVLAVWIYRLTRYPDLQPVIFPSVDWWNKAGQVNSWPHLVLWVPHHTAALTAALFSFLLIQRISVQIPKRENRALIAVASLALASAFGMSVWIGLVSASILFVWGIIVLQRQWKKEALSLLKIGVLGVILILPFALDLTGANLNPGSPVDFSVRSFEWIDAALQQSGVSSRWIVGFINLIALPFLYALELGFYGVVWVITLLTLKRRRPLDRETLLELTIFSTSIIIASFFKSAIRNNDLGWRGLMFAQFVLIVWGSDYIFYLFESYRKKIAGSPERYWGGSKPPKIRWAVLILVVLGSISTLGDLVLMRFFHVFAQNRAELTFEDFDPLLKKNTRGIRETFRWIHRQTPADAIIQTNPSEDINIFAGIYSARQLALADRHNSKIFGIPDSLFDPAFASISSLFREQLDPAAAQNICDQFQIDWLVFFNADPLWADRRSWIWNISPAFSNEAAKVFDCSQING